MFLLCESHGKILVTIKRSVGTTLLYVFLRLVRVEKGVNLPIHIPLSC